MDEDTREDVVHSCGFVDEEQKFDFLETLVSKLHINQAIIFCNSATRVEWLAQKIAELRIPCFFIHDSMKQSDRNKVFHTFRNVELRSILVSSDILARGIDMRRVNLVVNFDFPTDSESFVHRVGRTGRFDDPGLSITFVTEDDQNKLDSIEEELLTKMQVIKAWGTGVVEPNSNMHFHMHLNCGSVLC
eukprot:Skav203847  [mRNA]  locus=scaffold5703:37649:38215:+ [translate_table: standard]